MDETLEALIAELAPALAAAFLAVMQSLRRGINYDALVQALQAGDTEAAIAALNVDRGAFSRYVMEKQSQFVQAGEVTSDELTKDRKQAMAKAVPRDPVVRAPAPMPDVPAAPAGTPPPTNPPITVTAPGGGDLNFRFDMTNPRAEQKIRTEAATRVVGYVDEQVQTPRS